MISFHYRRNSYIGCYRGSTNLGYSYDTYRKDKITELIDRYPYYTEVDIPKGTYNGQEHDNPTVAVMAMLVVPEDLDEELVYNMTKTLFEHKQEIADTHDRGNDIQLETALIGMPIEVHPGAQRYYDEKGINK